MNNESSSESATTIFLANERATLLPSYHNQSRPGTPIFPLYLMVSQCPSSLEFNVNNNNDNNNINNAKATPKAIMLNFKVQPDKNYFLELLPHNTFNDAKRILQCNNSDLTIDYFHINQEMIDFSMTIMDFERIHSGQPINIATRASTPLSPVNFSRNSSRTSISDSSQAEFDQKVGGFAINKRTPIGIIVSPQQVPEKPKKRTKPKNQRKSKYRPQLSQYNSKIIDQVKAILPNPNDNEELLRRLDGLKLISKENAPTKSFNVENVIRVMKRKLSAEQLGICNQLATNFRVGLHTAIQIFILCDNNEFKTQKILSTIPPEECVE